VSKHYDDVAFTDAVRDIQERYDSRAFYNRRRARHRHDEDSTGGETLTKDERDYLGQRDSFYLATVSETGWPDVQFRGGPRGFLRVLDDLWPRSGPTWRAGMRWRCAPRH
jgi:uncharacterized protein